MIFSCCCCCSSDGCRGCPPHGPTSAFLQELSWLEACCLGCLGSGPVSFVGTVRGVTGGRSSVVGSWMETGPWPASQGDSTHSSVFRSCARPARQDSVDCSSSHWLSLLLRKSSRALMPRKLLALGYEPTLRGMSDGGRGTSELEYGQVRDGSNSRSGVSSWLPLTDFAVKSEGLLNFGCPGKKLLPLPRDESGRGLVSASSLVDALLCPSRTMALCWTNNGSCKTSVWKTGRWRGGNPADKPMGRPDFYKWVYIKL